MYKRKDHYWKKAKQQGFRSRAAYKLLDIQKSHKIFQKGDRVLDLGSAPGGWLQVIAKEVGSSGTVFGVDRMPVKAFPQPWILVLKGDLTDSAFQNKVRERIEGRVHVVASDMSPDLTGVGFQDHYRSCELVRAAFDFSREMLMPGGIFLAKIFQGEELDLVLRNLKNSFSHVKRVVPSASRKASAEIYLLAKGYVGSSS